MTQESSPISKLSYQTRVQVTLQARWRGEFSQLLPESELFNFQNFTSGQTGECSVINRDKQSSPELLTSQQVKATTTNKQHIWTKAAKPIHPALPLSRRDT